jgi:UDP-glucose 4-epimerase
VATARPRRTGRKLALSLRCKRRRSLGRLFNITQAAQEWGVTRGTLASTIGVYGGARDPFEGPLTEDMPLLMSAPHLIPTFKKISELLGGHLVDATGI